MLKMLEGAGGGRFYVSVSPNSTQSVVSVELSFVQVFVADNVKKIHAQIQKTRPDVEQVNVSDSFEIFTPLIKNSVTCNVAASVQQTDRQTDRQPLFYHD